MSFGFQLGCDSMTCKWLRDAGSWGFFVHRRHTKTLTPKTKTDLENQICNSLHIHFTILFKYNPAHLYSVHWSQLEEPFKIDGTICLFVTLLYVILLMWPCTFHNDQNTVVSVSFVDDLLLKHNGLTTGDIFCQTYLEPRNSYYHISL